MMNFLALCLVWTSLFTAGLWSPTPAKHNGGDDDVIVKEGHRVVVVEFEKENGNTRVSISPQEEAAQIPHKRSEIDNVERFISGAKDKLSTEIKEAVKEKIKQSSYKENVHGQSTIDLVCDALGKCKHKIANTLGKTKVKVSEKAHEVSDEVSEVEEKAKEAVTQTLHKATDGVRQKAHETKEKGKHTIEEASAKAKQGVSEKTQKVEQGVQETVGKAKHGLKDAVEKGKTITADVKRNLSKKMKDVKGKATETGKQAQELAEETTDKAEESVYKVKERGQKSLKGIFLRMYNVGAHMVSFEAMDSLMDVAHLLGFSTAYGMCFWVTFVSSYVLAGALPRQQFGVLQSKIYPVYFRAMAYTVGVSLLGHFLSTRRWFSNLAETLQVFNLLASFFMILANLLYLEPRAAKVMFERLKIEKEEGRGREGLVAEINGRRVESVARPAATSTPGKTTNTAAVPAATAEKRETEAAAAKSPVIKLDERLQSLNSYSSALNMMTLMGLTWHLVYVSQRIHSTSCN